MRNRSPPNPENAMNAKSSFRAKLGFESLETREVPAIVSVTNSFSEITVTADNNGSSVAISRPNPSGKVTITDNQTGQQWQFSAGLFGKNVVFVGGSGADHVSATNAYISVNLEGKGGNDILFGGRFKDYIDGGSGNDILRG